MSDIYCIHVSFADRMRYIDIYVTEGLDEEMPDRICYTIQEEGAVDVLYINCTQPMIGKYVKFQQHANPSDLSINLNICEVQVYGYPYHGKAIFTINTLGREKMDVISHFQVHFFNENIPIEISLKFVPRGPINNIPALVQIIAWRRPGDKSLSEPMMVRLLTHICVTRPQWANFKRVPHTWIYNLYIIDKCLFSWPILSLKFIFISSMIFSN